MTTINVKKDSSKITIQVSGQFDYQCHREFRDAYRYEPENMDYEIDLHRTEVLDSAALGMLLLLRDHAGRDKARITIKGCNPHIRRILEIASFDKLFRLV